MRVSGGSTTWWVPLVTWAVAGCGPGDGQARAAEGPRAAEASRAYATVETSRTARGSQELPEGVTPEMVAAGEEIFGGAGFCYTCHGADGEGVPQLGADLTDDEWTHGDGSYQEIVQRIREGVSAEASTVGVPMPPRGGGRLSDEQVRALAAYVWVLSRGGT